MNLLTKYGGNITIDPEKIIEFPTGVPGFEDEKQFILLDISTTGNVAFQALQSTKTPSLAFIVIDPYVLTSTYEFQLDETIIEGIEINKKEDVTIRAIVTVKSPFDESTLNLKAPIVINNRQKLGKQFIIHTDTYATKTQLSSLVQSEVKGDV